MNRRVMMVFAALAVLAALVILYLAIRAGDNDPAVRDSEHTVRDGRVGSNRVDRATRDPSGSGEPGDASAVREYVIDGVLVRDHRTGDAQPPSDLPPPRDPDANQGRVLGRDATTAIGGQLRSAVSECAKELPPTTERSAVKGTIFVDIKQQQLRVADAALAVTGRHGDSEVARFQECMRQKAIGLTTAAPGEGDAERFTISVDFALPRR